MSHIFFAIFEFLKENFAKTFRFTELKLSEMTEIVVLFQC